MTDERRGEEGEACSEWRKYRVMIVCAVCRECALGLVTIIFGFSLV